MSVVSIPGGDIGVDGALAQAAWYFKSLATHGFYRRRDLRPNIVT
jgi:hypothetical protein